MQWSASAAIVLTHTPLIPGTAQGGEIASSLDPGINPVENTLIDMACSPDKGMLTWELHMQVAAQRAASCCCLRIMRSCSGPSRHCSRPSQGRPSGRASVLSYRHGHPVLQCCVTACRGSYDSHRPGVPCTQRGCEMPKTVCHAEPVPASGWQCRACLRARLCGNGGPHPGTRSACAVR